MPSIERIQSLTYRRQQVAFCTLTLFVLAILLLLHVLFAPLLGEPSDAVIFLLGVGFSLKVLEIIWLQGKQEGVSESTARKETAISIVGIFILTGILAFLTNRDDAPYFVLLAIPILQSAYHFGLKPTIASIVGAIAMMFAWIRHYFGIHPPSRPTEYLQAGMIAVIFCLTGLLVWFLVAQLKRTESSLYEKVGELESTREKLVAQEKLAAVGRLASGVAHEIRNPVAMIASSLATATHPAVDAREREEMFAIAAHEARRLEKLTSDFLTYARPSQPQLTLISIADIVRHVANVARMRATERSIDVRCECSDQIFAEVDAVQIESVLFNLVMNALDATDAGGHIELRARYDTATVCLDVENSGRMIQDSHLARIFEPFFTTKPGGTGLGLAIARGIALAHGGDLRVSANTDGAVVFTLTVPKKLRERSKEEVAYGESPDRR